MFLLAFFRNDEQYFVIKILTAHETLQKPPQELNALNAAANQGYINLYDHFDEYSHHGTHLCLVLDIAGPSCEDLRFSSPTKSLSRHIVQRAIACVVEELMKLHKCGLIHGGSYCVRPSPCQNPLILNLCADFGRDSRYTKQYRL
jgi:hypothetical protein